MEKTLVILKPSAVQRALMGQITTRFEQKGLRLAGMKMVQLNDEILNQHYAHLTDKPFFQQLKNSMKACPVVVQCWSGYEAIKVVRKLIGNTNGREDIPGTVRGDFAISVQENVVHASDSPELAEIEINRFFEKNEIFDYQLSTTSFLYSKDEK